MARTDFHKVIIGRSDSVHFVDLDIVDIPAKVDTGAYRSAVHASNIALSEDGKTLRFELLGGHPVYGALAIPVETSGFQEVEIFNSFGQREMRYEVRLRIKIGPKVFYAKFSLANRSTMVYPILLGRKMLNNRFLVDSSHSNVNRTELKSKYAITIPPDEEAQEAEGVIV
jgi:hypothetical protein